MKRIALLPESSSIVMPPSEEEKTLPGSEPTTPTAPDRSLNLTLNKIQHSGSSREVEVEMEAPAPSSEWQSMAKFPISPKQQEEEESGNSNRQANFLNSLEEGDTGLVTNQNIIITKWRPVADLHKVSKGQNREGPGSSKPSGRSQRKAKSEER